MKRAFLLLALIASSGYSLSSAKETQSASINSAGPEVKTITPSRFYTDISGSYVYSGNNFDGYGVSVLGGFNISENKTNSLELEYIHIQLNGDSTRINGSLGVAPPAGLPLLPGLVTKFTSDTINNAKIKENMILCNYRHTIIPANSDRYTVDIGAGIGANFVDREVSGTSVEIASSAGPTITTTSTTTTSDSSTEFVGQVFGTLNVLLAKNICLKLGLRTLFTRDFDLKVKRATVSSEHYQFMAEAGVHIAF